MRMTETTKRCPRCERVKDVSDFHRNRSNVGGLEAYCKPCSNEHQRRCRAAARVAAGRPPVRPAPTYVGAALTRQERIRAEQRRHKAKLRGLVITTLGGKCAECGGIDRLELDHVNGDGSAHRSVVFRPTWWRQIVRGTYSGPPIQVLCHEHHADKTRREMAARRVKSRTGSRA